MALQLPSLTKDGAVSFESPAALEECWSTYVQKGALAVRPDRPLAPLEQLEVYLVCPGLASPVPLRVEVVHLDAERALLRLLDAPPHKPDVAEPAPEPEPERPASEMPAPTVAAPIVRDRAARTQELDKRLMPPPSADDPLPRNPPPAAVVLPPAPEPKPALAPIELEPVDVKPPLLEPVAPEPVQAAPAPPPQPQAMPPLFTLDALRFHTARDFAAARPHLESVGAILAVADGSLPTQAVDVVLAVGDRTSKSKVKITLSAAGPGTAVAQAVDKAAFLPLIVEIEAPPASATQSVPPASSSLTGSFTPVPGITPKQFSLPRQGTLTNPTTPEEILALPMTRPPSEADIAAPSVPLLLRWLRMTRGTVRLEATAEDHPVFTAVFVDGREVRTPASLATLGKSLALPRMSYTIMDLGRPPQMTTTGRTLHLIAEVIRGLCGQLPVEDLARVFPRRGDLCPRAVQDIVAGLGLPSQHQRFIKTDVNGNQFLDEIARAAVGGRTVWDTMYLLEVFNGLTWDAPPEGKTASRAPAAATAREKTGTFSAGDDDYAWAAFEGKDHFQVLGLHWSSSPTEVAPAYQKLRSEYSPGGLKRPSNSQVGEKILKRLEEAYKVLNDPSARRAYRREKYNLVWAHQAQLLVQKAKLALYRKDLQEAMNALLAAEDMSSSEEARSMLASIKQKTGG